ncbi:acetoacetyl-CoA synthetase [endosymbiont of unidentified scaly snail isolate Monju]|nr:acetoacetyl-CoA synthetase [endosymbiont of unidentified scaly snail isolate Monju]
MAWLREQGLYQDSDDFQALWRWSVDRPEVFWSALWDWHGILGERSGPVLVDGERMPGARFFPECRLNFAQNLLREADGQPALVFHGEDGRRIELSRAELRQRVLALAGWLRAQGVGPGDRVAAYVPNIPEAVITMLATASLGTVYSSCSPDFGFEGVLDRFGQIRPKVLIGVDGYHYAGKRIERLDTLSRLASPRLASALPELRAVLVHGYLESQPDLSAVPGAVSFDQALAHAPLDDFVPVGFNDPLYILYSSGTTGVPKCIVHGVGGTLLQHVKELRLHCDVRAGDRVFYFTTCGWMMWNWIVSALALRATVVLYDGNPLYPGPERLWEMAARERLTLFGTSAKYLDTVRKSGYRPGDEQDLSALRVLCSTGSPLSPEGFEFVYDAVSRDLLLASISGGTDIISCFVLGTPLQPVYAGEIQTRGLGMDVAVLDEDGKAVVGEAGELCCLSPFPSMPVGFWNDPDGNRYRAAYFEHFPGIWRHGDWATLTERGGVVIHGRSDAVLNPGGVRIGAAEIYRPVEAFEEVAEALVVGQQWEGDVRVILFVRLAPGARLDADLEQRLRRAIRERASPRHVPARILAVDDIPRTRSGKISELAVRDVVHGRPVKNTHALANPEALDCFRDRPELQS